MSSWYEGMVKCPHCGSMVEFQYHIDCENIEGCSGCDRNFRVKMAFFGDKDLK